MKVFDRVRFRGPGATFLLYGILIGATALVFSQIVRIGEGRFGSLSPSGNAVGGHKDLNLLLHTLIALGVVIVVARGVGAFFRLLGQPAVIGEVVGGILLGPSLLGRYAPQLMEVLVPRSTLPFLSIFSQLGVILYMFLVGLELDLKVLKRSGHATMLISHASIILPFLLGAGLALTLFQEYAGDVSFLGFALFLGASFSVTAFPVLARILADRGLTKTKLGMISLACAAVDDVTAWCLVAVVVSIANANLDGGLLTLGLTASYILAMIFIGRPLIARLVPWLETFDRLTESGMAIVCIALLGSALATEFIGIHAIFGAFLLGAITPHNSKVAKDLTDRLQDLVRVLFLPAFFAFTGLRVQIGLLDSADDWKLAGLVVVLASVGKIVGCIIAGRVTGLRWRESSILGVLMNTRGLVELIVLNLGLDLGILSQRLFVILVLMALVTTFMTGPLLSLLLKGQDVEPQPNPGVGGLKAR